MKLSTALARLISMSTAAPTSEPICVRNAPLPTLEQLPNDPETLKRLVIEVVLTLQEERRDREALQQRVALLLRRLYGPRQERFNPDQLLLFADGGADQASDTAVASPAPEPDASTAPADQRRRCKPHGRGKPSANLPRRPVHHELSAAERLCSCGQLRVDIGTDVSEQVDWQPASVFVWQHLIHKYLCPHCSKKSAEPAMATSGESPSDSATTAPALADTATTAQPTDPATIRVACGPIGPAVVSASKPAMPIAKGLPGPGLLAQVIVSKYFDHLPLYRQQHIFARQGVSISRSTMCDWMAACAELLRPLYDLMVAAIMQSLWLHTDDTPVKNQGHAPDATATARFWIYAGDRTHPYNVFDFTVNRKRDGPQKFLTNFHGYLHADAFSGYDALYLPSPRADAAPIQEVACNAHARRKFHEARGSDVVRSHQALAYYGQLYALERAANTNQFDDAQRLQMRQDFAVPILETFHAWLGKQRAEVLPKSPMAEAIGYALNNWTALRRYTEAGFLSIDNNLAEREMKRIAIGRKNWMHVGSDKGGQTAAVLFSFTSTCHRLGIEPWAYLQDVLARLPAMPPERLGELLPDRWQAARLQAAPSSAAPPADSTPASDSAP
ncbi:MAG: transposase [Sphingomonadales bacterium]|jgi:transposase|nr:transposase [Sphingomonadales bacterium]